MRRFLPSCPHWFRSAFAFVFGCVAGGLACAQEAGDGDEVPPVVEIIKQLVFIEEHLAETNVVDGIESPYDVRVAPDGGHVYVASQKNDAISYFARDEENGELTYAGLVTQADIGENALDGARSLAFSPDGEFVYAVSMFADSLSAFDRDPGTGQLTFIDAIYDTDGGVDGLDGARSIVVSPDGKNLYVAAYDDSKLSVFSLNNQTGVASFLGLYKAGDQGVEELTKPHALAVSPDGRHIYVTLWSNKIVVFSREPSTGLLTYVSKLSYLESDLKKESPRGITLSPDGKFVYVVSLNNDALTVFSRNKQTGVLTFKYNALNSSASVSDMDGPHAIAISADGKYVYVAAFSSDSVTSFERNAETGNVSYSQSIKAGSKDTWTMNGPISIGTSPDGEHVYVGAGSGTHSVVTFRRDVLVDPPEFVVQPVDQIIEEGESVAFHALAQGVDLKYQWLREGLEISGQTLPVLTIPTVALADNGASFAIRVRNPGGILTSSTVSLTVLPPVVVEAPIDLTALDISSNSARLVWKDQSDNETNFEIQRRILGGEFSPLAAVLENQVQYEDMSLASATTYIYRVRGKRAENVSLWSNDAVIESYDDAPRAPVNLNVVNESYNKVTLRWSDRSAVEDGFRIWRRTDEVDSTWDILVTADKNATTYVDRSVLPQSTYAYRVQAFNESGSSDYSNSVVAITSTIPVDSITPLSRTIPRDAVSGYTISVSSTKDWEAISSVDWLVVSSPAVGKGSGNQGVTYRSRINEAQSERTGKIVVGGIEHTVVQGGSPPFLRISPSRSETTAAGGTVLVNIESNVDWSASEVADWVSITSGQSGSNYGSVVLSLTENTSLNPRLTTLTVNEKTHTIEQAGKVAQLNLSAVISRFSSEGGSSSVTVSSNIAWSASVSKSWISLIDTTTGEGNGSIGFSLIPNETAEVRTADILVNNKVVTLTQDPPVVSDVSEPEWVRVTVGPLGAELVWRDLSDDELGFRIRRSEVGSGRVTDVVELAANATSYFDRDAPRGKEVEYRLVSFDAIGESDEVGTVSETIPSGNMTRFALRVEAEPSASAFLAEIPLAGDGEIILQKEGFGTSFGQLGFGSRYSVSCYQIDTNAFQMRFLRTESRTPWVEDFKWVSVVGASALAQGADGLVYAASTPVGSSAFPRGTRVLGQLLSSQSVIVTGFEIEGEIEIPVLLQAVGKSLSRRNVGGVASGLSVQLYRLLGTGGVTLLGENSNWALGLNQSTITIEDALSQTKATVGLDAGGGEARMLVMLGEGRYVAVLKSASGSTGSALLEVLDAR